MKKITLCASWMLTLAFGHSAFAADPVVYQCPAAQSVVAKPYCDYTTDTEINGLKINWCGWANGGGPGDSPVVAEAFLGVNLICSQGLCQIQCVYSTNYDQTLPFIFLQPSIMSNTAWYRGLPDGYGDNWDHSNYCRNLNAPEKCQFLVVKTTLF